MQNLSQPRPISGSQTQISTTPTQKPPTKEMPPLWLPPGSVRSILTMITLIIFFVAVGYSMIKGVSIPDTLNTIVVTIVAFYFGSRANSGTRITNNETASEIKNAESLDSSTINQ